MEDDDERNSLSLNEDYDLDDSFIAPDDAEDDVEDDEIINSDDSENDANIDIDIDDCRDDIN